MSDNDFINDPFERYIVQNPKKINYSFDWQSLYWESLYVDDNNNALRNELQIQKTWFENKYGTCKTKDGSMIKSTININHHIC